MTEKKRLFGSPSVPLHALEFYKGLLSRLRLREKNSIRSIRLLHKSRNQAIPLLFLWTCTLRANLILSWIQSFINPAHSRKRIRKLRSMSHQPPFSCWQLTCDFTGQYKMCAL